VEKGYVSYKGRTIPIESLISGFIKKGYLWRKYKGVTYPNQTSAWNARALVESFVVTDRQFTNYSTVLNAKGNQEQVRITNNHLLNEIDNIVDFLSPNKEGESPSLDEFLDRFSHVNKKSKHKLSETPASLTRLNKIYDDINPNGNRITSKKKFAAMNPQLPQETVDAIYKSLSKGKRGSRPDLETFLKGFHDSVFDVKPNKAYVPNQFLVSLYENYKKGVVPTVSQYFGLQNTQDNKGSVYKDSTALEQGIEDFLTYVGSTVNEQGNRSKQYLANVGTFADSPRKFFLNVDRVKFEEVFEMKDGKSSFKKDGAIVNSFYNTAKEMFAGDPVVKSKQAFLQSIKDSINAEVKFMRDNADELTKIPKLKSYFTHDSKGRRVLTTSGVQMVSEYVMNNALHGVNMAETFLPGVKGKDIVKRMKANSSPIFSVKNPNFKMETIFVSDEIINGDYKGTDSGMYILEEDMQKYQLLGKGVMEFNNGLKFLNHHVEKENPNFKGKSAYLKGYTTPVAPGHWAYPVLKAAKDKYLKAHMDEHGVPPSQDLSDGSPNHIAIIVPQSSDKSNFINDPFYAKDENGNEVLTDRGQKFTPSALKENYDELLAEQDKLYYDEDGKFVGLETYNFGPQQVMDKVVKKSNTPVQMVNSVLVNAVAGGNTLKAIQIQQHISNQKMVEFNKIVDKLKSGDIKEYRKILLKELNKEDMDQVQRVLLEDGGSVVNPAVNEILVNQLAKTILRAGNKLATPGTLAHQKPDTGYNLSDFKVKSVPNLEGYSDNHYTGGLNAAHIVLPKHMNEVGPDGTKPPMARESITMSNTAGQAAIHNYNTGVGKGAKNANGDLIVGTKENTMNALKWAAVQRAGKRFPGNTMQDLEQYIGQEKNAQGIQIGYYVKGDTIIASRVPGHGPSSTGVYEVIAFDNSTDGNQVMISGDMNAITGADNDGDALFIQTKGNEKQYAEWNKAFDLLTEHWLSDAMKDQVTTKMEFEDSANDIKEALKEKFPNSNKSLLPFSPEFRRRDYNNTMVSKRNVGKIFNLHKAANMLAAYETTIASESKLKIGGNVIRGFSDFGNGANSRNQLSAELANIILDNTKHGFADAFGLDEHNMAQAALLVNMGVPLKDVAFILNSKAAKTWSDINRNNDSMYHTSMTKAKVLEKVYDKLGLAPDKKVGEIVIDPAASNEPGQQKAILQMMSYLADMNSEVQKLSGIMSGHNKIHINPFVLEKQLTDFNEVVNNRSKNQMLHFSDEFKVNPDLQQYQKVARETLKHTKNLNPVYRASTKKVLDNLTLKIRTELSPTQIERISSELHKFNTSRLLGLNNKPKAYVDQLMANKGPNSIYVKVKEYVDTLRGQMEIDPENKLASVSSFENSMLFRRALNFNLHGTDPYISANASFTDESFNAEDRVRIQKEFEELPPELQDDLIMYDLVKTGWKGPITMMPFFGKETFDIINRSAEDQHNNKYTPQEKISPFVLNELERIIALKHSDSNSNPFMKVRVNMDVSSEAAVIKKILSDEKVMQDLERNQDAMYVSVIGKDAKNKRAKGLYELAPFSVSEINEIKESRDRRGTIQEIAKRNFKYIPNTLSSNADIDVSTIADKNIFDPVKTVMTEEEKAEMELLTEATITWEEGRKRFKES